MIKCEKDRKLGNVYGCDDECSDIHGKEFPGSSKFHHEYNRSHFEEKATETLTESPTEFEWNNLPRIHNVAAL